MKKKVVVLIAILVLAIGMRAYLLADKPLSLDEPHSILYVDRSLEEMFSTIALEYRTPVYYLSLWVLYSSFSSVLLLKVFSVLLGVVSVLGIYVLGKEIFSERIGLLVSFLLAISPVHIAYSQYVREYSLFFLFFIFSMLFFWRAVHSNRRRDWIVLAAANTLMFMTHFLAVLLIASQLVGLLLLKMEKKLVVVRNYLLQVGVVGVVSLPWLLFLFGKVELLGIGNFVRAFDNNPIRIGYALYKLSIGVNVSGFLEVFPALLGIVIPFFALLFLLAVRHFILRDRERGKLLFTLLLLPMVLLFLISVALNQSLFIYRYFSPVLVVYLLIIAAFLASIRNLRLRALGLGLLVVLYAIADLYYYSVITLPDWPAWFGI